MLADPPRIPSGTPADPPQIPLQNKFSKMVSRILSGLSADILLMVSCSTWAHISRKLHSCTTAANALLQQLLWQAIPFGLAGQCVEAVRHLHAQASHIEIIINVRHCTLQAVCKLLRRLLPWHLWPASLLTPAKPRHCSLVEEDVCHIGRLCMWPSLRMGWCGVV